MRCMPRYATCQGTRHAKVRGMPRYRYATCHMGSSSDMPRVVDEGMRHHQHYIRVYLWVQILILWSSFSPSPGRQCDRRISLRRLCRPVWSSAYSCRQCLCQSRTAQCHRRCLVVPLRPLVVFNDGRVAFAWSLLIVPKILFVKLQTWNLFKKKHFPPII